MTNEYARVEEFEKRLKEVDYFIDRPTSFLYDQIPDPNIQEIVECTRAMALNNHIYLLQKKEDLEKLKKELESVHPIVEVEETTIKSVKKEKCTPKESKDITELVKVILYSCIEEDSLRIISSLSHEELILVKLYIQKLIIETKKEIKLSILTNPTVDIAQVQDKLNTYEYILELLKEQKEQTEIEEQTITEISNIIIAPNLKDSTYLYEDIENYPERTKEIKLIIDKIIDGYFLKTKDTKSIEGYNENLYEYKHPNGIRILYFVKGNIIIICSLFFKDKQKSIRITSEYDEAIKRYYESETYIKENFTNPDFHIEQDILIGQIYSLIDAPVLSKKAGDL